MCFSHSCSFSFPLFSPSLWLAAFAVCSHCCLCPSRCFSNYASLEIIHYLKNVTWVGQTHGGTSNAKTEMQSALNKCSGNEGREQRNQKEALKLQSICYKLLLSDLVDIVKKSGISPSKVLCVCVYNFQFFLFFFLPFSKWTLIVPSGVRHRVE